MPIEEKKRYSVCMPTKLLVGLDGVNVALDDDELFMDVLDGEEPSSPNDPKMSLENIREIWGKQDS